MRVFGFVSLGVLLVSSQAFAADGGADSGPADAGDDATLDASDDASTDASSDLDAADAEADASSDAAKDASSGTDASGQCCPSLPCTCPADAGNETGDAGDAEGAGSGGCSCQTAPLDAGTLSPLLLLAGAALIRARARKPK